MRYGIIEPINADFYAKLFLNDGNNQNYHLERLSMACAYTINDLISKISIQEKKIEEMQTHYEEELKALKRQLKEMDEKIIPLKGIDVRIIPSQVIYEEEDKKKDELNKQKKEFKEKMSLIDGKKKNPPLRFDW